MKLFFSFTIIIFLFCPSLTLNSKEYIKNYNVSTKGIKIGEVVWALTKDEKKYEIKIILKSKGLLSSVYKFNGEYLSFGRIENNFFIPKHYSHKWITKNKEKNMVIHFFNNKISSTTQKPSEKELSRVNLFDLIGYSDPLTSFVNIFNNKDSSKTVDGRRIYKMVVKKNLEKPGTKTIIVEDYKNIYADHKRNDLEKIIFSKQEGFILPELIFIYFKGSVFKVYEN
tara:strand:+ start:227 stop:904 length:678 start_codon:yes stop_codon:yes gene_type:complete